MQFYNDFEPRLCTQDDVEAIADIEREIFLESSFSEEDIRFIIESQFTDILCAEKDGEICGYIMYSILGGDTANIDKLAVTEEYRGNGLSKKILRWFYEVLPKEVEIIQLEVRKQNEIAVNLYLSENFRQNGLRKDYYKNPLDDAVLMELELKRYGKAYEEF